MTYTIDELKKNLFERVYNVYEVFSNFFGEEYTDLQDIPDDNSIRGSLVNKGYNVTEDGSFESEEPLATIVEDIRRAAVAKFNIFVYWPRVTVSNENNKSIVITDLYAKITIDIDGQIPYEYHGFKLNRSSYTEDQYYSNYMHSHISDIPISNLTEFQRPCLGTGPIADTIHTLKNEYDEITWMLFCQELSLYVTVESLRGVPYNYLETVGMYKEATLDSLNYGGDDIYNNFVSKYSINTLKDFIKYYLENGHLSISYNHGNFVSGLSSYDFIIDISNAFIDYYNQNLQSEEARESLFRLEILRKILASNGKFFEREGNSTRRVMGNMETYLGRHICKFKGQDITFSKAEQTDWHPEESIIMNPGLAFRILHNILRTINYRHKNEHNNQGNRGEETSLIGKRIFYI